MVLGLCAGLSLFSPLLTYSHVSSMAQVGLVMAQSSEYNGLVSLITVRASQRLIIKTRKNNHHKNVCRVQRSPVLSGCQSH